MSWIGYYEYGGTEIINAARTEAYARSGKLGWFRPVHRPTDLHLALNDEPYRTPLQDDNVPWVDPLDPATYDFYGAYPLDVSGIEDSTRTSSLFESSRDGGVSSRLRHATRQVVFSAVLIGATPEACDSGLRWLSAALLPPICEPANTPGSDLCYFSAEPCVGPDLSFDCSAGYLRTLTRVVVTTGPTVTSKRKTSDGAAAWSVTWTATCGNPAQYSAEVRPWAYRWFGANDPYFNPAAKGAKFRNNGGFQSNEIHCHKTPYQPLFDPDCPVLIAPPGPPSVRLSCIDIPAKWHTYRRHLPVGIVPLWTEMVPVISLATSRQDVHTLRFRFYADPGTGANPNADPCSFCSEFVITYLPKNGVLHIDGVAEQVIWESAGNRVRAEHMLSSTTGQPFDWPVLSCGSAYLIVVDSLATQRMPYVDFTLRGRSL